MKDPPSHKSRHDLGIPLLASFRSLEISNKRWKCKELNGLWFLFEFLRRCLQLVFHIQCYSDTFYPFVADRRATARTTETLSHAASSQKNVLFCLFACWCLGLLFFVWSVSCQFSDRTTESRICKTATIVTMSGAFGKKKSFRRCHGQRHHCAVMDNPK